MELYIQHQESYSRGELLLRTFFGWFYMLLPHAFLLIFAGLWGFFLLFVAFWVILFTGKYPETMFEYQLGLIRWDTRLAARLFNLSDGYPAFGIKAGDDRTRVGIAYPEKVDRALTLLRLLLGIIYVVIPHGVVLALRAVWVGILGFLAWWTVLFTAYYPEKWHRWVVSQVRWQLRVTAYMLFMTDTYPPFTGREIKDGD